MDKKLSIDASEVMDSSVAGVGKKFIRYSYLPKSGTDSIKRKLIVDVNDDWHEVKSKFRKALIDAKLMKVDQTISVLTEDDKIVESTDDLIKALRVKLQVCMTSSSVTSTQSPVGKKVQIPQELYLKVLHNLCSQTLFQTKLKEQLESKGLKLHSLEKIQPEVLTRIFEQSCSNLLNRPTMSN